TLFICRPTRSPSIRTVTLSPAHRRLVTRSSPHAWTTPSCESLTTSHAAQDAHAASTSAPHSRRCCPSFASATGHTTYRPDATSCTRSTNSPSTSTTTTAATDLGPSKWWLGHRLEIGRASCRDGGAVAWVT